MKTEFVTGLTMLAFVSLLPATEFHVATSGRDANPGTKKFPFCTIQHAADLAQPGDVITVHAGTYRERINPPRGGTSDRKRIVYQAASGERIEIKGSEVVTNWVKIKDDVWQVTLPNAFFGSFNPYADLIHGDWFDSKGRSHHTGAVYLNGDWLTEAAKLEEVLLLDGTSPAWLTATSQDYLLNVAWLRPVNSVRAARISTASFAAQQGVKTAPCSQGGECIGWIENGAWVRYEDVDFGQRTEQVELSVASATAGGIIELRLDTPTGELIGSCVVVNTGGWQAWTLSRAKIKPLGGVRNLCLVFKSSPADPHIASAPNPQLWFAKVDATNTTIWAQFKGTDPNQELVEINVRQTVFTPEKSGVNYITLRGFHMSDAATPWAPPTAGQLGMVSAYWCKGWIIENNEISYSKCCGIALGKYSDEWDNHAESAEGYVGTIHRALTNGWNRATIGHHLVRNNVISHCGQAGIVGSLGCAFSNITGNTIHDIHLHSLFGGAEMAGIKFHGAIDVVISHNHVYRCGDVAGIWLDWMAQGAQLTANLMHDNTGDSGDIFFEMQHGPILAANNLLLSKRRAFGLNSQGIAFAHNLVVGPVYNFRGDNRSTPYHPAHRTEVAGLYDASKGDSGDHRFYNNIFAAPCILQVVDSSMLPCFAAGNVFTKGTQPSKFDIEALVKPDFDAGLKLERKADGWYLTLAEDKAWRDEAKRQLVTTARLGKAKVSNCAYEDPDGSPLRIATDYFGKKRDPKNPFPGPFEISAGGNHVFKVWPVGAPTIPAPGTGHLISGVFAP